MTVRPMSRRAAVARVPALKSVIEAAGVLGHDPAALRARVGVQLRGSALPDRIRVEEALWMFGAFYREPADVGELMATWGLERVRRRPFAALSGGERRMRDAGLSVDDRTAAVVAALERGLLDLVESP